MTLSKKLFIIPVVLGLFSYLFYSAYKSVKDRTLYEFNIQQFTLASQASRGIESFFIYYQRELQFLSKIKSVSDLTDQGKNILTNFYNSNSDQIQAISVVDSKGILKFTYPLINGSIGQDISNQPHIKTVIKSHTATVSDVFTSVQGYRTIAYHIPIMEENEYKGSIAILIPIEQLGQRYIENIRPAETGYAWMMSEIGIELFNPSADQTGKYARKVYSKMPSVLKLLDKTTTETGGTSICSIDGKKGPSKILAAFYRVPLGNTFWTIMIFTPEKEVYAKFTSFRNRLYTIILLIIIIMSTYFYLALKASNILKEEKKRKAVEKTLTESEKRFRVMFEISPTGILLIDENGTIIEINHSFCETLGYTRDEVIGNNVRLFSSPVTEGEIERNISQILSGKTIIHEVTDIKKDGTTCVVELRETLIVLPDGKRGILSISNDVTEKKASQERMLTLSRALESIGECVTITDVQNVIKFVNNTFCKIYGYNEEEIIGKNINILRVPSYPDYLNDKILSDTIMHGGWNGELINIKKDGSEFPIELTTSSIKDENNNPIALIGIAVDITERKKVQMELINSKEKAEESDRLKSAFLANMSHELRTPLNAIIGFSSLIVDAGPDANTNSYSQIILKSGQHLLSLVEDIFDITMIEAGQTKINYEETNIVYLLEEVKDIISGESLKENKTGVELILKSHGTRVNKYIITDTRKLKQILLNLLRNALKFTDKGYIEFGFTAINDAGQKYIRFYVKDTGIGIDRKHHDTIFNMFRQIDDSHTRKFGGMGLGLSIAKKTVEKLGGHIWVESEPNKGSVFYFTIPDMPPETEKTYKTEKELKMRKSFTGKTILVAEDERSNFDFLKIMFNKMDIKVLWAKDGREAVNICENDLSVDLILMDIKMPVLNGYEATKAIKKMRPSLPIIALTAYAMIADKQEAERAGCDAYMSKPIKANQLLEILEDYL